MPAVVFSIQNSSDYPEQEWRDICDEVFQFLFDITPVDTGNCRDSLRMNYGYTETDYIWDADYASYLDNGWSNQAPEGMTKPALRFLRDLVG